MNRPEMVKLLTTVQLGDNRNVDGLVVDYWLSLIGDLELDSAMGALRRFRRERPGVYLEPGHLLELAGVEPESPWVDRTAEVMAAQRDRDLAELGTSFDEYRADPVVRARVDAVLDARQLEQGEQ